MRAPLPLSRLARRLGDLLRGPSRAERITAPQLFALSFAGLIAAGTVGFRVLPGLYADGQAPLSWVDALFTATSAVCVTGLAVADTAARFTVWGQAWILLLVQLGGLGFIALSSLVVLALGRRLSLRAEALTVSAVGAAPHVDERRLVRNVVVFTVVIEAAGAVALWAAFRPTLGAAGAVWPAVFHSISAFCNAGFSTFSTNLVGFESDPAVLGIVGVLIVVGGLGFLTLEELALWVQARRERRFRLSLHSSLALATTAVLLVGGTLAAAAAEWNGVFAHLPPADRWLGAAFFSVTARTAGFNAIDYGALTSTTAFLTILLMFVGGSPGSTAGGAKTTTVALVALLAYSRFRGRRSTGAFGRSVPPETVDRAVGVTALGFAVVTLGILALTATEGYTARLVPVASGGFLAHMFEAVSALGTVGLSMNLTPTLDASSKLVVVVLMFVGRIGPLTAAAVFARTQRRADVVRYAHEDVLVG